MLQHGAAGRIGVLLPDGGQDLPVPLQNTAGQRPPVCIGNGQHLLQQRLLLHAAQHICDDDGHLIAGGGGQQAVERHVQLHKAAVVAQRLLRLRQTPLQRGDVLRRAGLRALNLNEDDALVDVRLTDGEQNILIATHTGKAICFDENEVRAMGRTATGVRGIKLADGDYVIGAARARKDAYVLSVTENGYGKRTPVEEFTVHHRGGGGIMLHSLTAKTGLVAGIAVVDSENDVMIITDDGVIIRTGVEEIRECGRGSQGVIVMRTGADVKVISIARTDKEEEDETAEESTGESAAPPEEPTAGEEDYIGKSVFRHSRAPF